MALSIGQKAPDFSLPSTSGKVFTLSEDMKSKPCILYFYPKDFSPACTQEACKFKDNIETFREVDIDVLGISRDSVAIHRRFRAEHRLPFDLLADESGKVCTLYDAVIPIVRIPKRITYLLDKDHTIVEVVSTIFSLSAHVNNIIDHIKAQ